MGYCIYLEAGNIAIKKDNMNKVLDILEKHFEEGNKFRCVNGFTNEDRKEREFNYDF